MPVVRRVLAVLLACTLLAACHVDAGVDVAVADDGSGTVAVGVTFDADAVARTPDLATALRTDDLTAAGWTVTAPETQEGGSVVVRAQKPFAAPEQLPAVLAEVSSAFRDVRLERSRSFGEVKWTFDATVDFSGGAEGFGDDQLATLLGGRPLGRDIATLEQEIGTPIADATGLTLHVELPGGATQTWSFRLGQPATPVHLESTIDRPGARLWAAIAIGAAALLVLVVLVLVVRRIRRRRAAGDDLMAGDGTESDLPEEQRRLQLVVTAAHGVLWESHEESEDWLMSLVTMQGRVPVREEVRALRHEVELGRLSSADFWRALGLAADARELDAAFVARFTLDPRVVEFVTTLARRGVGVACVTNDGAEWSAMLRERFGLSRFIRPWIVSAELGATVPGAAPLEEVAWRAGIPLANCLYLDDQIEHLDAARRLGMATALLGADGAAARAAGHGHLRDFGELLARAASTTVRGKKSPMTLEPLPEDFERVLAVVAHPDDLEYGAASAIARWTAQGKDVRYLLATRGEAGIAGRPPNEVGPRREAEQRASAAVVGVSVVEFLDHADGMIDAASLALRRDLARGIRVHRPHAIVSINFRESWGPGSWNHVDHRVVGVALLDAVRDAANPWVFPELRAAGHEAWDGTRFAAFGGSTQASHWVDVSDTIDRGVASLREHKLYLDGLGDGGTDPDAFLRGVAADAGAQVGVPYAATFEVIWS